MRLQWQPKAKPAAGAATHSSARLDKLVRPAAAAVSPAAPTRNAVLRVGSAARTGLKAALHAL